LQANCVAIEKSQTKSFKTLTEDFFTFLKINEKTKKDLWVTFSKLTATFLCSFKTGGAQAPKVNLKSPLHSHSSAPMPKQ
jgi:hypothetical protein